MTKLSIEHPYLMSKHPWLTPDKDGNSSYSNNKFFQKYYVGQCGLLKGSDGTFILKPLNKWKKATGSSSKNNKLLKNQSLTELLLLKQTCAVT